MPLGIRNAAIVCLVLSALCGLFAAQHAVMLLQLDELRHRPATKLKGWPLQGGDQQLEAALAQGEEQGQIAIASALESMRELRALTLIGLAAACALSFVGASRMLRPFGLPREGVRRLIAGAALAAGILRTIDGAQLAVVAKRQGIALGNAFKSLPAASDAARLAPLFPKLSLIAAVLQTLVVAGAFLLVSQFFRSERVKQIVAFRDSHPEG